MRRSATNAPDRTEDWRKSRLRRPSSVTFAGATSRTARPARSRLRSEETRFGGGAVRLLVTGGFGVIGSWVTRRLIEEGHQPVCFSRRHDTRLLADLAGGFDWAAGDVADFDALRRAVDEHQIDQIIHLAAFLPATERDHPREAWQVNAMGACNVLEAARLAGHSRLTFTSSRGVFGSIPAPWAPPDLVPLPEDAPKEPLMLYDIAKRATEDLCGWYERTYGLVSTILRFPQPYGPGRLIRHGPVATVSLLIEHGMLGKPTHLPSGGDIVDDLVYVRDAAQGIVRAALAPEPTSRTYHVGGGRLYTLFDVVDAVRRHFPQADVGIGPGQTLGGGFYGRSSLFDISRAEREIGYQPEYDLDRAIDDYAAMLRTLGLEPGATE